MVFHRRMSNRRPIHSIKHIVDQQAVTALGVKHLFNVAAGVDAPVITGTADCETGSTVNSIFLNIQVIGLSASGILNQIYMIIYKNPGQNVIAGNIPNANVTGASDFKRQIFHTEMIMGSSGAEDIPQTLFKGVLKIPKPFRIMRNNDLIQIQLFSPGGTFNVCLQTIYKEFR